MNDLLPPSSQVITFEEDEDSQGHELIESDILVYGTIRTNARGSSKVKLKNIVDYKWEVKNYPGHLIAVHIDGKCVAYVIKVTNKVTGPEGMVRVMSGGKRALIKGMTGEVLDIQFAYTAKQHILACAEVNALHIYKINITAENLNCILLLEINDPTSDYIPKYDKISWCPYVPDDGETDEDANQLIVWARGHCFQCFSVNTILKCYGNGKHSADSFREGHLKFTDNTISITWVALSPDGTTLSVGSDDGYIRFYQVYFHEKEPRCLHQWNPHNGKPISSFFFLDNLTKSSSDAYWKHALTGAVENTEFKIWDCGTWDCLQVLSLRSNDTDNLFFTADIDLTASYLILSSIEMNVVYVVQLVSSTVDDKAKLCLDKNERKSPNYFKDEVSNKVNVFLKSISEFALSSPILSLSIVDATVRKYKFQETESLLAEDIDEYEEENTAFCVVIRMFVVQPKSVQECHIIYQPTVTDAVDVRSSLSSGGNFIDISQNSSQKDLTSDIEKYAPKSTIISTCTSPKHPVTKTTNHVNLLTPDSFKMKETNNQDSVSTEVFSTILMLANATNSSNSCNATMENINLFDLVKTKNSENRNHQKGTTSQSEYPGKNEDDLCPPVADRLPSGGSSPSREVQQIFSKSPISQNLNYYLENIVSEGESMKRDAKVCEVQLSLATGIDAPDSKDEVTTWSHLTNSEKERTYPDKISLSQVSGISTTDIKELNAKIDNLTKIIQSQSNELCNIKNEISFLRKENNQFPENLKQANANNQLTVSKTLEESFNKHEKSIEHHLENMILKRNLQCQELNKNLVLALKEFLYDQFSEKQINSLSSEIQKQITSLVYAKLDVMEHHLKTEIARRLSNMDQPIRENISQLCKSKSFVDTFGESIVSGVQKGLQNAYIQSMSSTLIPAYEKSSREMFKQLHETFTLGIKDVIEQFDGYLCQLQPFQEGIEEISGRIQCLVKDMETALAKKNLSEVETHTELKKSMNAFELTVLSHISDTIQKEVRKNFETQAATFEDSVLSVVRSRAHTPAPSVYDVQDQIRYLLFQGQINKAFHQALIANDLVLVEYVLQKAEYKHVFNPCALEQTVLLSLIQQISADMENHNEVKQRYLADALLNLNHSDPITKEHAPRVIKEFCRNCQNFLKNHPKNPLCSNIRMIMMAVQGMGFKVV